MWTNSLRSARRTALVSSAITLSLMLFAGISGAQTVGTGVRPVTRLTQTIDESQLVTLKGTVHPLATAVNDRGAVADGTTLERMQIQLKRSAAQETALRQLIQDMHTPGSASYHKWLTPETFGAQFGPTDEDIATLSAWLANFGFSVTKVNPGKQTLEFSGSAGQFRTAFHTEIHKFEVNGQIHTANVGDPQIPAALAPVFGGFAPLNNFHIKNNTKLLGAATLNPATHKVVPSWTTGDSSSLSLVLAPGDFAVQYNLTPLYSAGTNGTGQTIAIINDSNISVALANQYRTLFGLPANAPNVIIDGNDPGIDGLNNPDGPNGDSVEAYLDVEQSGAVAPDATIDLVIAADTTVGSGLLQAAQRAVYSDIAPVLSLSFGGCEAAQSASGNAFINQLWEQAAAQGQTVMVSTGDSAAAGCDGGSEYAVYGQAVNGLASTPWNVAVGGTDFYYSSAVGAAGTSITTAEQTQLGQYWNLTASNATPTTSLLKQVPEQPWNNSQFGTNFLNYYNYYETYEGVGETTIAGGGGGASNCATGAPTASSGGSGGTCAGYAKPSWQAGTGVPSDGVRDLPDVSLFAANGDNLTYYPICAQDGDCQSVGSGGTVQFTGVGGTSASSPAFAGIIALVNQKYGPQGQADFVLYPLATQYPSAFNDVTEGSNTVPCAFSPISAGCIAAPSADAYTIDDPTYGTAKEGEIGTGTTAEYNAGTGFDLASGLGTINAYNLVTNWTNVKLTATSTTLSLAGGTYSPTASVTISGTVSPSVSTGSVELMTTSSEALQAGLGLFPVTNGTFTGQVYLPGGAYNVYASYSGGASGTTTYAGSTSTPVQVTVAQSASSVTLQASNELGGSSATSGSSVTYGTQLLLTATPSATGAKPTGTVTFTDSGTVIGTASVSASGTAVLNWAPAVGGHSVTATYGGSSSATASTSTAFALTVTKNTPDVNLFVSASGSSTVFEPLSGTTTLTVQVSNSGADVISNTNYAAYVPVLPPTGVVTITGLGSSTLTFPSLQAALQSIQAAANAGNGAVMGTAVLGVPSTIPSGTYNNVVINYPGDTNYLATTSSGSVVIAAASGTATTTTATASPTQTSRTAAVTISGSVTGASNQGVPTGTVVAEADGYEVGSYTLGTGSGASAPYSITVNNESLTPGVNVVTLQYFPGTSSPYAPSIATVTISNGSTAYYTLSNSGPINVGEGSNGTSTISVTPTGGFTGAVALSCVVTPAATTSTPTCSIASSATVSGISPATTTLTLTTGSSTTAGTYVVTVTGTSGGQVFTTSVPVVVSAVAATPAITLSSSGPITENAGTSGMSTITVTPSGGFTGAVTLTCAVTPTTGTSVPTCTVTSPVTISGTTAQTATLMVTSTATTTTGAYTVTVTGTASGVTTATTPVGLTVNAAGTVATPTIALSALPSSVTIATAGGGATSTITATLGGGLTASGVSLSCSVAGGTTYAPTCSLSGLATGAVAGQATATLTVSTTAATGALAFPKMRLAPIGGGVAMAGLLFFLLPVRRRKLGSLLGALVLMAFVGFSAGCGSGGGPSGGGGTTGTPAGTYTVTVTGTATGATTAMTTVTVVVQ
jgi:hypothetical protein